MAASGGARPPPHGRRAWAARLASILAGVALLFALLAGLELLVSRLAGALALGQLSGTPAGGAHGAQLADGRRATSQATRPAQPSNERLANQFELIYEDELELEPGGAHYVAAGRWREPVSAERRLRRLLEAHQAAMPFDADVWRLSEPAAHMHLLSGDLARCQADLGALVAALAAALGPGGAWAAQGAGRYRLAQWLDATGRPEAGALLGQPFWPGSYAQCERLGAGAGQRQLLAELAARGRPPAPMGARYCVAKAAWPAWPSQGPTLKVGVCLPRHCDSWALFELAAGPGAGNASRAALERVRRHVRRLILLSLDARLWPAGQLELRDLYCLPLEERRRLAAPAWPLLAGLAAWLALVAACTWWPGARRRLAPGAAQALALDGAPFGRARPPGAHVRLEVLDGLKHLGCAAVVGAHVLLVGLALGGSYAHTAERVGADLRTMLVLSASNVVDTFLLMSGLLAAYLGLARRAPAHAPGGRARARARAALGQYARLVAGRYLRMAPLYLVVYAFAKTVAARLGSGPLWDYATNWHSLRGACRREHWLWPLLMASDLKPLAQHCVPAAWSLGVDLQLFLVVPLLVGGLRRWPRAAHALLAALVLASTLSAARAYTALLDHLAHQDLAKLRLHVFTVLLRHAAPAYSQPHNRMGPVLVGVAGGRLLHEYERRARAAGAGGAHHWPKWMRGRYLLAALLASLALLLAPCLVQLRERAKHQQPAGLARWALGLDAPVWLEARLALAGLALIRPLWSVCQCVLLLRLATDLAGSWPARLLALEAWRAASKLNYAILLVHFELILYESQTRLALSEPLTWTQLVAKFAFAYLGSLLVAVPLYVLVERPAGRLAAWWLAGAKNADVGGRAQ